MDHDGQRGLAGQVQLVAERLVLDVVRREVAVEVEPHFAEPDEAPAVRLLPKLLALLRQVLRAVRVQPGDGMHALVGGREGVRLLAARRAAADLDDRREA